MPAEFFTPNNPLLQQLRDQARDMIVHQLTDIISTTNVTVTPKLAPHLETTVNKNFANAYWSAWFNEISTREGFHTSHPAFFAEHTFFSTRDPREENYLVQWSTWAFLAEYRKLINQEAPHLIDALLSANTTEDVHFASFADIFKLPPEQLVRLFFSSPQTLNGLFYPITSEDWNAVAQHPAGLFLLNLICTQDKLELIFPDDAMPEDFPPNFNALRFSFIHNAIQPWSRFIRNRMEALDIHDIDTASKKTTLDSLVERINQTRDDAELRPLLQLLTETLAFFNTTMDGAGSGDLVEDGINGFNGTSISKIIHKDMLRDPGNMALEAPDLQALEKLTLKSTYALIREHFSELDIRQRAFLTGHALALNVSGNASLQSLNKNAYRELLADTGAVAEQLIQAILDNGSDIDSNNNFTFMYWLFLLGCAKVPNHDIFFEQAFAWALKSYLINAPELEPNDNSANIWDRLIKLIKTPDVFPSFISSFLYDNTYDDDVNRLCRLLPHVIGEVMKYACAQGNLFQLFPLHPILPTLLKNEMFRHWAQYTEDGQALLAKFQMAVAPAALSAPPMLHGSEVNADDLEEVASHAEYSAPLSDDDYSTPAPTNFIPRPTPKISIPPPLPLSFSLTTRRSSDTSLLSAAHRPSAFSKVPSPKQREDDRREDPDYDDGSPSKKRQRTSPSPINLFK